MNIHKEGYKLIPLSTAVLLLLYGFLYWLIPIMAIQAILGAAGLILFILIVRFFRDPEFDVIVNKNQIIAPADGKVVVIEETNEDEYLKDKRIQVSIFMSPLNVHSNHYPIDGNVVYTKYHPGKFLVAWNPKSSTKNERSSVVIENTKISVLVRQIAGALARRIVTYSKRNEQVTSGEELGFIKFGSRVDLYLPLSTEINVKLNEKVKAKISIIAKY